MAATAVGSMSQDGTPVPAERLHPTARKAPSRQRRAAAGAWGLLRPLTPSQRLLRHSAGQQPLRRPQDLSLQQEFLLLPAVIVRLCQRRLRDQCLPAGCWPGRRWRQAWGSRRPASPAASAPAATAGRRAAPWRSASPSLQRMRGYMNRFSPTAPHMLLMPQHKRTCSMIRLAIRRRHICHVKKKVLPDLQPA